MDIAVIINNCVLIGFTAAKIACGYKISQTWGNKRFYTPNWLVYLYPSFKNNGKPCCEWHLWFEYADIDVVGMKYKPIVGYIEG